MTLVSVIIPTYQRPRLLMDRAIPSVLAQTVQDQEVIVVGDGTDAQTCIEMGELVKVDRRFRFVNLPHYPYPESHDLAWGLLGLAALNWGLDHAQGEWISVLGDDDEYLPNHHEVLLEAAARTAADHVYGIAETYKAGHPIGQQYGSWPPGDGAFCNGANLYRASLGYRYSLDCTANGRTGDADLWTRMREDGVRFHFEPKVVLRYHRNWP
ncbi:MAG TPA: glycosyltransferase family 2 protein [Candidatus Limnocylindrales bacterium]